MSKLSYQVGVAGFEPATSCSQSRRANRATLHPEKSFFPEPVLWRPAIPLWPDRTNIQMFAERGGFEPPVPFNEYGSLANCWFQPLTHLSFKAGTKV
jgi:hypothetical protein